MSLRLFWNFVCRLGISPHHSSALTNDIFQPLVIPQAEESRVSQLASRRPLGESDLSNELRFHPMHTASRQPVLGKGSARIRPDGYSMKLASALVGFAALTVVAACSNSAFAMPVAVLVQTSIERTGYICDTRGRCWWRPYYGYYGTPAYSGTYYAPRYYARRGYWQQRE
jgi:hypothetical protein